MSLLRLLDQLPDDISHLARSFLALHVRHLRHLLHRVASRVLGGTRRPPQRCRGLTFGVSPRAASACPASPRLRIAPPLRGKARAA